MTMTKKRIYYQNVFYHVTSNAITGKKLFNDTEDFQCFTSILATSVRRDKLEIIAYCLMNTHFHLLLRSQNKNIGDVMRELKKSYAIYYKKKYNFDGKVFINRYWSKPLLDTYALRDVSKYIHLNPIRALLVKQPLHYPFSSYRTYHFNEFNHSIIKSDNLLKYFNHSTENYCSYCTSNMFNFTLVKTN